MLDNLKIEAQITNANKLNEILSSLDENFTHLNLVGVTSRKAVNEGEEVNDSQFTITNYFIVYMIEALLYSSPTFSKSEQYKSMTAQEAKQLRVEIDGLTKGNWYHKANVEKLFFN